MSVKLGYISNSSTTIKEVQVVKQDIPKESFFNAQRSGNGDIQSVIYSEKATIHLESDHLSTSDVSDIRTVLANRQYPHKIFLAHPATNQEYTFDNTDNKCYTSEDNIGTGSGSLTEFTSTNYTNINKYDNNSVSKTSTSSNDYSYLYFGADLSDFVDNQGIEKINRITLAMKDLLVVDGDSTGDIGIGYLVEYYDCSINEWVEIKRQGLTVDSDNIQFASVRPIDGFSNFENAILVDNLITFRVRNLYAKRDTASGVTISMNYAKIFVNGYGCVWNNEDNFTYSDTYTGAGWTGNIELLEL